jgi:hypothetical protein
MRAMRDVDIQNRIRDMNQMGRTTTETIIIDNTDITEGVIVGQQTQAIVNGNNVELNKTAYKRRLNCGHFTSPTVTIVVCGVCQGYVCDECVCRCDKCHRLICNRCSKVFSDGKSEKILCRECEFYASWDNKVNKVFGFFVKQKEDK